MSELSPAARAVFESFNSKFDWVEDGVPGPQFKAIAAALRALTRTSLTEEAHICGWFCSAVRTDDILAIADELEAQ